MKRLTSILLLISLITFQLLSAAGCDKQNTTTTQTTTQEQTTSLPQASLEPIVNLSKDPSDYEIPSKVSGVFSITCVSYVSMGKTHFVDAFADNKEGYSLVLPYSVGLENVALYFNVPQNIRITINSRSITTGISFFDFSKKDSIKIGYSDTSNKTSKNFELKVYTTRTPIIYLDVDEKLGTVAAMHADMSKNTHCYGVAYIDSLDNSKDVISHFDIHGHGNSTWQRLEKRPYNIKFTDDGNFDSGRDIGVLGMSASSKWCFLADVWDRTITRNRLAHYLGKQVEMDYAIETRYVHLYLGSEYRGSYLMTEKAAHIEEEVGLDLATGDNMDGSWIVEFDNASGQANQFTVHGVKVTVKSPVDGCAYTALKKYLTEVSTALRSSDGYNKNSGKYYYDYLDLESYAKFILIREFTMDYDTVVDHWAYYDAKEGKMNAGPLWDFDNSMGNSSKTLYRQTSSLLVLEDTKGPGCWLMELMKFEKFREILKTEYQKYSYLFDVNDPRSAYAVYESWFEEAKPIAELNDLRWDLITDSNTRHGFEQDNSQFAIDYAYVAKFLYNRSKAYGNLLMGL